jgi:hypothetical protein
MTLEEKCSITKLLLIEFEIFLVRMILMATGNMNTSLLAINISI